MKGKTMGGITSGTNRYNKLLHNPLTIFKGFSNTYFSRLIPDKAYLKFMYRVKNGERLNLKHPNSFTDKINWLKINDKKPIYTQMVDKYLARDFVSERIGADYLVPLLGVWDKASDINFNELPDQFVLKCNHNSGNGFYMCHDKRVMDKEKVIKQLNTGMKEDFYYKYREWPYKNVKRKIIAEPLMQNTNGEPLVDYKVFCFAGEPKFLQINSNRFSGGEIMTDFYDVEWNYLNIQEGGGHYPQAGDVFDKPLFFEELLNVSSVLSQNVPQLRVDFNCWDNKLYFGELTFYHNAGMNPFMPEEWNDRIGDLISI